jgi:predicted dehydrogenase
MIPRPRPLDPALSLRWGLVGVGGIAGRFADALSRHGSQRVQAVASRSPERAARFAAERGVPSAAASVDELLSREDIDVIYVATPHQAHREVAEAALRAGRHVLVEKPMAATVEDAAAITSLARERGLLAMEAMWTRYLPQWDVLMQLLEDGAIGDITSVSADFGFVAKFDPEGRLWSPALAGGALLDAGVYPVSFAVGVLGIPDSTSVTGTLASTGVDDHAHVVLSAGQAIGTATTSLRSTLPVRAVVSGTSGRIEVGPPFILPSRLSLTTKASWMPDPDLASWEDVSLENPHDGLHYEADAAARYIAEGRVESPIHTHQETIAIVSILERARRELRAR